MSIIQGSEPSLFAYSSPGRFLSISLAVLILILILSITILSLVPPVGRDDLVHHLAIPKMYLNHGGFYEIPAIEFSYYPMNLELLYLIPLYLGNDIAPKFIHFGFALLTAWLIFDYLKRKLNSTYALLGILFFLSIPIIIKLSISVYVDLGLICFSTASLLHLLKWLENRLQIRFLISAGIFCGLALGTKYNGLITFFLLTVFTPFIYSKYHESNKPGAMKILWQGIVFSCIALLIFSPWMIRNYHWKKNPIYPLYDKWFNPAKPFLAAISDAENKNYGLFTYRTVIYNETWQQIALLPIRIFFQGEDGNFPLFDGKLNPMLFFFPILAFYPIRNESRIVRNEKKILLCFAALFFAFTFFSSVLRIRYLSPFIPPLVILSVFGVNNLMIHIQGFRSKALRKTGVVCFVLILIFFLGLNASYIRSQFKYVDPFSYLNGSLTRDEYITKFRPEYPAMQYINSDLPKNVLIMFVYLGKRGYYCDRDYLPDRETDFIRIIQQSKNGAEACRNFKDMGVTHLAIQIGLLNQWIGELFSVEEEKTLQDLLENQGKLLFFKHNVGVFELPGTCNESPNK